MKHRVHALYLHLVFSQSISKADDLVQWQLSFGDKEESMIESACIFTEIWIKVKEQVEIQGDS